MSRLMRTSEVTKRPVVTLAGEDVAQIKDVVYSAGGGAVGGFTLAGRGLFAGPLKQALSWSFGDGVGPGRGDDPRRGRAGADRACAGSSPPLSGGSGGDVLGSQVLTDAGTDLGTVVDVILEVEPTRAAGSATSSATRSRRPRRSALRAPRCSSRCQTRSPRPATTCWCRPAPRISSPTTLPGSGLRWLPFDASWKEHADAVHAGPGRKVVSTSTAETVGQVADFVIDAQSRTVVAVTLNKTERGDTVLWSEHHRVRCRRGHRRGRRGDR